jgi:NADH dehydrogenase
MAARDNAAVRHVVVLGAGFAGLHVARGLRRAPVRVTVIDRQNHHLFQPMLYQVATAALSPGDIASPVRAVLRRNSNVDVLLGDAERVDLESRTVMLSTGRSIQYDYLVVATGARHSYFGHEEWERFAPGLKDLEDGLEIRHRILLAFERAEQELDPGRRAVLLNFVIVGGGPTGVELAGAIAELRRYTLRRDFRNVNPSEARVLLIEGGPRILPGYPETLSAQAQRDLERLGVEVRTAAIVTDISADGVVAGGQRIATETAIWAAGNVASPLLRTLGAELDAQGRAIVNADCSLPGRPEVFVLGDAAAFLHQTGRPLPGVCQVAMQMGDHAARIITTESRHEATTRDRPHFHYRDKGNLAVIGRGRAVGEIGRAHIRGFLAWLTWIFVHIFFLIGFRNRIIVLTEWAISYFTFSRGARLITSPVLKPGVAE